LFAGCHGAFCEKSIIYACHVIFRQKSTKTERKEINPTKPSQTIMSWVAQIPKKQKKSQKRMKKFALKWPKIQMSPPAATAFSPFLILLRIFPPSTFSHSLGGKLIIRFDFYMCVHVLVALCILFG